jgi:hypothetical protein
MKKVRFNTTELNEVDDGRVDYISYKPCDIQQQAIPFVNPSPILTPPPNQRQTWVRNMGELLSTLLSNICNR